MKNSLIKKLLVAVVLYSICFASQLNEILEKRPQPAMYQTSVLTTISGSMLKTKQQNESTLYVSGNMLRTDTDQPTKTITLRLDDKTWLIGPDGTATQIEKEKASLTPKKPEEILAAFTFTETQKQNDQIIFTGIPRSNNPQDNFSTTHFSKVIVIANTKNNTIEDIKIYNKNNKLSAHFSFTYTLLDNFWMNQCVTSRIYMGNQSLIITQTYNNTRIVDLPPSLFDLKTIQQNGGR